MFYKNILRIWIILKDPPFNLTAFAQARPRYEPSNKLTTGMRVKNLGTPHPNFDFWAVRNSKYLYALMWGLLYLLELFSTASSIWSDVRLYLLELFSTASSICFDVRLYLLELFSTASSICSDVRLYLLELFSTASSICSDLRLYLLEPLSTASICSEVRLYLLEPVLNGKYLLWGEAVPAWARSQWQVSALMWGLYLLELFSTASSICFDVRLYLLEPLSTASICSDVRVAPSWAILNHKYLLWYEGCICLSPFSNGMYLLWYEAVPAWAHSRRQVSTLMWGCTCLSPFSTASICSDVRLYLLEPVLNGKYLLWYEAVPACVPLSIACICSAWARSRWQVSALMWGCTCLRPFSTASICSDVRLYLLEPVLDGNYLLWFEPVPAWARSRRQVSALMWGCTCLSPFSTASICSDVRLYLLGPVLDSKYLLWCEAVYCLGPFSTASISSDVRLYLLEPVLNGKYLIWGEAVPAWARSQWQVSALMWGLYLLEPVLVGKYLLWCEGCTCLSPFSSASICSDVRDVPAWARSRRQVSALMWGCTCLSPFSTASICSDVRLYLLEPALGGKYLLWCEAVPAWARSRQQVSALMWGYTCFIPFSTTSICSDVRLYLLKSVLDCKYLFWCEAVPA